MKCPFCKDDVSTTCEICPHCRSHHHMDCWILSQGCAVFGCQGQLKREPELPERIRLIDSHFNQAVSLMRASITSPDAYVQLLYRYGAFANITAVCNTLQDLFFKPEISQNLFRKLKSTINLHQAHELFMLLNVANLAVFLAQPASAKREGYGFPQTELRESEITRELYSENVLKRTSRNGSKWLPQFQELLSFRDKFEKSMEFAWSTKVYRLACDLCFDNSMTIKSSVTDVRFFGKEILSDSSYRFENNCHYLWHWGPEDFTGFYFEFERCGLDAGRGRAFRKQVRD